MEDVYIVDARGNVITCRQIKRRRFNNFFDEYGISLRISLMNAEACEKKKSVLESPELIYLAKGDKKVQFLIENSTSDAVLSVCGYLWQNQFDDKHIKKKSTELKYDKK